MKTPELTESPKKVIVWVAGAIGGTIGAHAARHEHEVTFVDNDAAHVAAIQQNGLNGGKMGYGSLLFASALTGDSIAIREIEDGARPHGMAASQAIAADSTNDDAGHITSESIPAAATHRSITEEEDVTSN